MAVVDQRFDAVLIDYVDGSPPDVSNFDNLTVDWLPMMLLHKPNLGYSENYATPYTQNLSSGDKKDNPLGNWIAQTKLDFSGGALQEQEGATTNRYWKGTCDTRYGGKITLPPKVYGPYALPGVSGVNVTMRWERMDKYLYCVAGGKLFRSTLSESALSGGAVIPNWSAVSADPIWTNTRTYLAYQTNDYSSGYFKFYAYDGTTIKYFDYAGTLLQTYSSRGVKQITPLMFGLVGICYYTVPSYGQLYEYYIGAEATGWQTSGSLITGDTTIIVNGYLRVGGNNYILTNRGIWGGSGASAQVVAFNQFEAADAGSICVSWRGAGYIGLGDTIQKFDGSATLTSVGLDREGNLDSDISRKVRMFVPTDDTLYVLFGESGKRCSIWSMTGDKVWHCLYVGADASVQIYSIGIDMRTGAHSTSGLPILNLQSRLWWAEGVNTYYMYVGKNDSGINAVSQALGTTCYRGFRSSGSVYLSHRGSELNRVMKYIGGATVTHKVWPTTNANDVQMSVVIDRSGIEVPLQLKSYDEQMHRFVTTTGGWAKKKVTAVPNNSQLTLSDATGIAAGAFMRVGRWVVQVKGVSGTTVTLVRAPQGMVMVGDEVIPAPPCGFEYQLKMTLNSSDSNSTPEVLWVTGHIADQVLGPERYTLRVRCADTDNNNSAPMPYPPDEMRVRLKKWAQKGTPVWLFIPTGELHLVRIVSSSGAEFKPDAQEDGKMAPDSVVIMSFVEMGEI